MVLGTPHKTGTGGDGSFHKKLSESESGIGSQEQTWAPQMALIGIMFVCAVCGLRVAHGTTKVPVCAVKDGRSPTWSVCTSAFFQFHTPPIPHPVLTGGVPPKPPLHRTRASALAGWESWRRPMSSSRLDARVQTGKADPELPTGADWTCLDPRGGDIGKNRP